MTDINKQIEEDAREYDWQQELFNYMSNEHDILLLNSDMHEVYMICQKEFTHSSRWRKVSEELPPEGEEVLFFHEDWIDEDFNPKGIRIGFYESDDYTTAKWWSIQDCYMTISHSECDDNPSFSDKTRNSIEPQSWKPID